MKKLNLQGILQSGIAAITVYMLFDLAVEKILMAVCGISSVEMIQKLTQKSFDARIHFLNLIIFSAEIFLVMFFYAIIRSQFPSCIKPVIITVLFFQLFISLTISQLVNFGIYPFDIAVIVIMSTLIVFPFSVITGALVYDKIWRGRIFS